MGTPLGSFVTTDDDSNYTTKWYKKELKDVNRDNYTTLGDEATQFSAADGGKYVVIVTATVNDGYRCHQQAGRPERRQRLRYHQ